MSPRIYDYSEEKVAKLRADFTELQAENERLRVALAEADSLIGNLLFFCSERPERRESDPTKSISTGV